jgi:hypothetical protein
MDARRITSDVAIIESSSGIVIQVRQSRVPAWALEITLLLETLSAALMVESPDSFRLTMAILPAGRGTPKRSQFVRVGPTAMNLDMARNQAEFLQAVLLRA